MNREEALKRLCHGCPDLYEKVMKHRKARSFIGGLRQIRMLRGLSYKAMAEAMQCSYQKVVHMEYSQDDNLLVGDVKKYLEALGYELLLVVQHKEEAK